MTFNYLDYSDLIIPDGFTNWEVYWERKGPGPIASENAKIFLEERGCIENSRKRWRLGKRKWEYVDPEIRRAVDFLCEKNLSKGWTTVVGKEKSPSERLAREPKVEKKKKIKYKTVKARIIKPKVIYFRDAKLPTFENDCE